LAYSHGPNEVIQAQAWEARPAATAWAFCSR
jgi:hypothetical protein